MTADNEESHCRRIGSTVFSDVRKWLESLFHFDEMMDSSICALWVHQTRVYQLLPRVFHIFPSGTPGSGKTQLLNAMAALGKGAVLGNISVAAMARELGRGREVKIDSGLEGWSGDAYYHSACFDEFAGSRAEERRDEIAEMMRHGYARNGAPYTRWDMEKNKAKSWNLYMPMAASCTSTIEPALASRGFRVSATKYKGPGDWDILINNRYPRGADELNRRLDEWADAVRAEFEVTDIEVLERSPEHKGRVEAIAGYAGLDRLTEHALTGATVSYLVGMDVTEELKHGIETVSLGGEEDEDLVDEISDALLAVAKQRASIDGASTVTVKQSDVKRFINDQRELRHLKPLGNRRFAEGYRAAGIRDSWIRNRGNRNYWVIPMNHLRFLDGLLHSPNSVNIADDLGQQGGGVGRVWRVGTEVPVGDGKDGGGDTDRIV